MNVINHPSLTITIESLFFELTVTLNYDPRLVLLMLDLKLSNLNSNQKYHAGKDIAYKLIVYLFEFGKTKSRLNIILCLGHVNDFPFFNGFMTQLSSMGFQHLNRQIGWDVSMNDNVSNIVSMWKTLKVNNVWQGDGISNCISAFRNFQRLFNALYLRDSFNNEKVIKKVYRWTIDFKPFLRETLK